TSEIPDESWKSLHGVLWNLTSEHLPSGSSFDGVDDEEVETTKFGIQITCTLWTVPKGDSYPTTLVLARPRFSSILDFTPKKLEAATILDSSLEPDGSLIIQIG
ncbi:MAG TPA: hypothetical protein VGE67_05580, partial [Haloferula sp.]